MEKVLVLSSEEWPTKQTKDTRPRDSRTFSHSSASSIEKTLGPGIQGHFFSLKREAPLELLGLGDISRVLYKDSEHIVRRAVFVDEKLPGNREENRWRYVIWLQVGEDVKIRWGSFCCQNTVEQGATDFTATTNLSP